MTTVGLIVRLEAKPGKEHEVAAFLRAAQRLVDDEPETIWWTAVRSSSSSFAIIDAFADEAGRQAHLTGPVAAALTERADELLAEPPRIEPVDVLADKRRNHAGVPAGIWRADPVHSSARFEIDHMGLTMFSAGFADIDATLSSSGSSGSELRGRVTVASLDVPDGQLRSHIMAPDFLDAERHPQLSFHSSEFRENGNGLVVAGTLTIKGTALPVQAGGHLTAPIVDPFGNERLALHLETVIDRTDFGLGYSLNLPSGAPALGDNVKLAVVLELVKER